MNFIARWDGTSWTALHTGTDNYVTCLAVYNGKLIAGGYFSVATTVANFIAQWDGTSWSNVGSGMGGAQAQVMALSVYGSDLIAGGYFTLAGGVSVGHIAKWNGTAWSGLDGGIDNIVFSLTTYGSKLYAGGLFDHAGGLSAKSIAAWDGTSWSPLGAGIGGSVALNVMALQVYNNRLIVGGLFQTAGGITVNSVARWDGSNWSALGNGVTYGGATSNINALAAIGSELIAGGVFDMAGLVNANYIAHWTEPPVGIETPVFSGSADFSLSQNYPEPCRAATTISFQIPSSAAVKLAVYDGSGREIAILLDENLTAGSHAVVCKTADYPAGFYFYRLQHNQRLLCRKMCVVN